MKRLMLLVTVATLMLTLMAATGGPASAQLFDMGRQCNLTLEEEEESSLLPPLNMGRQVSMTPEEEEESSLLPPLNMSRQCNLTPEEEEEESSPLPPLLDMGRQQTLSSDDLDLDDRKPKWHPKQNDVSKNKKKNNNHKNKKKNAPLPIPTDPCAPPNPC